MRGNKLRVFAAGVTVGILVIYFGIYLPNIPNTSKPVWLARDPGDDAAFSAASATASASPDLVAAPSPALAPDSIPDTAPAPPSTPDIASAEQTIAQTNQALVQDASIVPQVVQSPVQSMAQAYSDYASQHGVDVGQSFNQIVTVLGNQTQSSGGAVAFWSSSRTYLVVIPLAAISSARPVVGAIAISYNAPAKTFTVVPAGTTGIKAASIPNVNGPTYYVKTTVATGKALIGQTAQNDFYGASKTFVNGLGSNTLKWSQK